MVFNVLGEVTKYDLNFKSVGKDKVKAIKNLPSCLVRSERAALNLIVLIHKQHVPWPLMPCTSTAARKHIMKKRVFRMRIMNTYDDSKRSHVHGLSSAHPDAKAP